MCNHNPAKECSIRNFNQQINPENVFLQTGCPKKNTAPTFNWPFVVYFPSPVKRVLVGDLLRKERTVDLTFFCFCLKWLKGVVFEGIIVFALFDSYAFLDCSTNFVGHDGTHRNRTRCKLFCFILEDMLNSVKCFGGSQFYNWLECWRRPFSIYIILRSFFLHFLHKISFSSKNQNKINFILTWMVVFLSFGKFQ